jgi:hypothetical protein
MAKPINDIWKDPQVQEALKDGRSADDIAVIDCPKCGKWGYYNEGSHFTCRFCKNTFFDYLNWESIKLSDTVTVTTEGYDNETLSR